MTLACLAEKAVTNTPASPDRARTPLRAVTSAPRRLGPNDLNFSAGPGALPHEVLLQAQSAMMALPETGVSILGMSHRSEWFDQCLDDARRDIRTLLGVPEDHHVLFLQGGSSLQFSMIPMNFGIGPRPHADYVVSGYWSAKSIVEARSAIEPRVVWNGQAGGFRRLPAWAELPAARPGSSYLHYVSNETVEGLQFRDAPPDDGRPIVCDMSSDFLSRRFDPRRYGLVYAHAQKNLGPSGVTVAIVKDELLERVPDGLAPMLDFRTHVRHGSNYNTPPVFGIYVVGLVLRWIRERFGNLEALEARNQRKATALYGALDALGDTVQIAAAPEWRSSMNAAFRFRDPDLQALFLREAAAQGFSGLEGHRAVGGLRVSLYNAVSEEAVQALVGFIDQFARRHG